jgi:cytochrome c biogenesis protein CcdA
VGTSFAAADLASSFAQFVLYALGMGTVIMALTVSMALFRGAMVGGMRRIMPYVQPIGTWLMIVAGTYIVFYWLTLGELLR